MCARTELVSSTADRWKELRSGLTTIVIKTVISIIITVDDTVVASV